MNIQTLVRLPFLWGRTAFKKEHWSQINLIVGPNGSGKTLLAQELAVQFQAAGLKVSFLWSEKTDEEKLLHTLKDNAVVREKIETVLSGMFGKSIRFEEHEDGSFVPFVVNKARGVEYNLREGECHGLKEILKLLVALYSTEEDCLIFDEPELHLHPQFQMFFISEIRKVSKEFQKKMIIIITHSPFFIDLPTPEDLIGVIVCHVNRVPTHIDKLTKEDRLLFSRFLPRFNTYHKQFFFSDNQIFVEGYTDQQMLSGLLKLTDSWYASVGTGIIDVGGKDELGVFCKVCSLLGTDGRIIADLDSLFRGKLRDVVCEDSRTVMWLEKQREKQDEFYNQLFPDLGREEPVTLDHLIVRLEQYLTDFGNALLCIHESVPQELALLIEKLKNLYDKYANVEDLDTYKAVLLQGINGLGAQLYDFVPKKIGATVPMIKNLSSLIFAAAAAARVYILPKGCIEHYYVENHIQYMPIAGKDRLFHTEKEHLLKSSPQELRIQYRELIEILEQACAREPG